MAVRILLLNAYNIYFFLCGIIVVLEKVKSTREVHQVVLHQNTGNIFLQYHFFFTVVCYDGERIICDIFMNNFRSKSRSPLRKKPTRPPTPPSPPRIKRRSPGSSRSRHSKSSVSPTGSSGRYGSPSRSSKHSRHSSPSPPRKYSRRSPSPSRHRSPSPIRSRYKGSPESSSSRKHRHKHKY